MTIRRLPEGTVNRIAAGEVVERPASVVKELVENALDAGPTRISVDIQAGGRSLIRVADNGSGMNRDDALLCLERHATSKIQVVEDLAHGFDGFLLHPGDLGYAEGSGFIWDVWGELVEPISSRVPYMVTVVRFCFLEILSYMRFEDTFCFRWW